MSDKHVVAALQRSVADLELRLREAVRERDEAYEDRRKARQERDLARSAWAGAEDSLVAEREHAERLTNERDEVRAEVSRCHSDLRIADSVLMDTRRARDEALVEVLRLRKYSEACEWALESEQEYTARLKADLALECREVAERQREACAAYLRNRMKEANEDRLSVDYVRALRAAVVYADATPLVTEGEP